MGLEGSGVLFPQAAVGTGLGPGDRAMGSGGHMSPGLLGGWERHQNRAHTGTVPRFGAWKSSWRRLHLGKTRKRAEEGEGEAGKAAVKDFAEHHSSDEMHVVRL
jgi:hypothetical protein